VFVREAPPLAESSSTPESDPEPTSQAPPAPVDLERAGTLLQEAKVELERERPSLSMARQLIAEARGLCAGQEAWLARAEEGLALSAYLARAEALERSRNLAPYAEVRDALAGAARRAAEASTRTLARQLERDVTRLAVHRARYSEVVRRTEQTREPIERLWRVMALRALDRSRGRNPRLAEEINRLARSDTGLVGLTTKAYGLSWDRPQDALQAAEGALAIDPGFVPALAAKGQTLARLKRYGEARQAWERGAELAPDDGWLFRCVLQATRRRSPPELAETVREARLRFVRLTLGGDATRLRVRAARCRSASTKRAAKPSSRAGASYERW